MIVAAWTLSKMITNEPSDFMTHTPERNFKSLPFNGNPSYKAYLDTTFALGIVSAHYDMRYQLCVSYVNLAATPATLMTAGACPLYILPWNTIDLFTWLGYTVQHEHKLELAAASHQFVIDWLIEAISSDNYVYLTVNEKHLPGTWPHARQISSTHPSLLIGFDKKHGRFLAYAYRSDGSFGLISPSFSDLVAALVDRGDKNNMMDTYFYDTKILTIKKNESFTPEPFNKHEICKAWYEYIDSQAPGRQVGKGEYFGLSAISYFLTNLYESKSLSQSIDLRGTRALMEHRNIVASSIEYIATKIEIPDITNLRKSYQEVSKWAQSLHLLCYQNMVRMNERSQEKDELLTRHLSSFNRIQDLDRQAMISVAERLENKTTPKLF